MKLTTMTPEVTYKQNIKSPCQKCGAKKSVASIPLPDGAKKSSVIRVCFMCWKQAVHDGYLAVYDGESESAASVRQDEVLRERHRAFRSKSAVIPS